MVLLSAIEVRGLSFARPGFALGPIDLELAPGGTTAVLGPSGAGKTTLLRSLAGFLPLRSGTIRVGGRPVEREPPERRHFGFIPPTLGLLPHRRVARNVSYPRDLLGLPGARAEAERWMERLDLTRLAHRYPSELSSGERQRVAIARALAARSELLLWDEPLGAVDVESRDRLLKIVREVTVERALPLLLVTHDPSVAGALASELLVLDHGRCRFRGTPRELAAAPLDRFTARWLGYENIFSPEELERLPAGGVAAGLVPVRGPGGVVVPSEAIGWRPAAPGEADVTARVAAVRWTGVGWSIALEEGPLTLWTRAPIDDPPAPVGAPVRLTIDVHKARPLEAAGAGG